MWIAVNMCRAPLLGSAVDIRHKQSSAMTPADTRKHRNFDGGMAVVSGGCLQVLLQFLTPAADVYC